MHSAEIIPIGPYLTKRNAEGDREAQAAWAAFEDRIEARAAAYWDLDGVPDPIIWDLASLRSWDAVAAHFGLDGYANPPG